MSFVCIVPARGASRRIKNKNLKLMAGKPLIAWTIQAAKKAKYIKILEALVSSAVDNSLS